jgi:Fic family protein
MEYEKPFFRTPIAAETTINVKGGGIRLRENIIDPEDPSPARSGLRYSLNHWTLGKLERLAKARFRIREMSDVDLEDWKNVRADFNRNLVQSVNASSEIEGEAVHVDKLSVLESPVTEPAVGAIDKELETRLAAIKSIYETYLWMLCRSEKPILTYELLLECHQRMFSSTKGEAAGKIKTKPVFIRGGSYHITTLSPEKTELFLRKIIEEFNHRWELSTKYAEYSRFLLIAEFILDFLAIHPFADGNGRTARLLSTYLLEKAGYHFARFYPVDTIKRVNICL